MAILECPGHCVNCGTEKMFWFYKNFGRKHERGFCKTCGSNRNFELDKTKAHLAKGHELMIS